MKKLVSLSLCLIMICSMSVSVFGLKGEVVDPSTLEIIGDNKAVLSRFSDVSDNHWAYKPIMEMVSQGLFAGTTAPDASGVGTFSPDATMSRAQFITVVTRYLFANSLANMPTEGPWYTPNWNIALEMGILNEEDFGGLDGLNHPISRQEMAYVITNVLKYKEDLPTSLIDNSKIADYNTIGQFYLNDVVTCYSAGIICGVDSKGSFMPMGNVSRAQGAMILYRLINPEARQIIETENVEKEILSISKKGTLEIGDFDYPDFESLENKNTFAKVDYDFGTISDGETTKVVPLMEYGHNFTIACEQVRYADILYVDEEKYECGINENFVVFDIVGYNEKYSDFNITDFYITLGDATEYPNYEKEYKEMGLEIFTHTNVEIGKYMGGYVIFKVSDEFLNSVDTMSLKFYHHPTCDMIPSLKISK